MKILYVAKHNSGGNRDEEAITWSLRALGHEVVCLLEREGIQAMDQTSDFCLMHRWTDLESLSRLKMPLFLWNFDRIDVPDRIRFQLMVEEYCRLAFYTDGDWVLGDPVKRRWLCQGFDERNAGIGSLISGVKPVIFTGMCHPIYHGSGRAAQLDLLAERFGDSFGIIGGKFYEYQYGKPLADTLVSAKVVIAPRVPATDDYWSNRVYLTTGLGGFLLHPYCTKLTEQYEPGQELIYYRSHAELEVLISYYLGHEGHRMKIRQKSHKATMARHTYKHRCEHLIQEVLKCL